MLFSISSVIGFSYLGISILFLWSVYKFNKYLQPKLREVRDARNQTARTISELYRFVFLIKNEVAEKKSLGDLDNVQDVHQDAFQRTWIPGNNLLTLIRIGTAGFRYLTILFAVWLLFNGYITAGAIFLIFTWSQNFIISLWMITDMQKQFITDKINIEKYFELLEIKPDVEEIENPISENLTGDIEFKNVEFSYPVRKKNHNDKDEEELQPEMVLKGISFKIKEGEKVAFVGESGSGKSTIANLVRRAFDPQSGEILINGNNLRDLELKSLLKKIGSVDQEVNLFDKSIRDNISYGTETVLSDEELNKISKMARIDAFYKKLEHGWDTIVGERGAKVSGGEKQRIGIARALAKNPEILIFDEATSALDTVSERVVQKSIDAVSKEPFVNKEKLGAVGASFGGYSVYWLAGNHQNRFKAFIAHCGMFNMESWYGSTEEMFFAQHDNNGPYWYQNKPSNFDASPHRFVQNWNTPILVIHNEKDYRVPVTQGMEAFTAAQSMQIPSKFLYFPDENHWVTKPQNSVLWQRVFFEWLDQWLKTPTK
jgi:ABC-type multidrug transport system fused ATPase/permease subunit